MTGPRPFHGRSTTPPACVFRIKALCQQFPQGITDQVIQNDMPHLDAQQRAVAINKLLSLVRGPSPPRPPTFARSPADLCLTCAPGSSGSAAE